MSTPQIIDGALVWRGGFEVDADGSGRAYSMHGEGLDYLANAGHPGDDTRPADWFGVITDTGKPDGTPVEQGPGDPHPGYLVSATALQDHAFAVTDPRRYIDSENVAYVAIPRDIGHGVHLGDLAWVARGDFGRGAICADISPAGHFANIEGSIALAEALQIPSSPKNGGCSSGVLIVVFPGSRIDPPWPMDIDVMQSKAQALFWAWGGADKLVRIP